MNSVRYEMTDLTQMLPPKAAHDQEAECAETTSTSDSQSAVSQANARIKEYLLANVPTFIELSRLRMEGWANPQGDKFFQNQRSQADKADERGRKFFYILMRRIGQEIHESTKALRVINPQGRLPQILDMCMAPGAFLETALRYNPGAHAVAFTLPEEAGGHEVLLPRNKNLKTNFIDVTMLAEDMGVAKTDIPPDHPEAASFLPQYLPSEMKFDLVLCDGQVLRTHEPYRASYRERREARRLKCAQLALGLEHIQPGGTMIVLLHKVEAWETVCLLYTFSQFSDVRTLKPQLGHNKRSSFYMIAQKVQAGSQAAVDSVQAWKREWNMATFSGDEEYKETVQGNASVGGLGAIELLKEFGPALEKLGEQVWRIQADALATAPFMKK